jgi:hypothetical protein
MTYIDSVILNLTERSCRKFQLLTGRTNVWLAVQLTNLSIVVYFVWAGVYSWSIDVAPRLFIGLFCAGLLYVLTQTIFKVPIEAYENDAYRRSQKAFGTRDEFGMRSFVSHSDSLPRPVLSNSFCLRQPSRDRRPPDLLSHRLDGCCVVPAGLRSASPVRWETERVASRISSVTTGGFKIGQRRLAQTHRPFAPASTRSSTCTDSHQRAEERVRG